MLNVIGYYIIYKITIIQKRIALRVRAATIQKNSTAPGHIFAAAPARAYGRGRAARLALAQCLVDRGVARFARVPPRGVSDVRATSQNVL